MSRFEQRPLEDSPIRISQRHLVLSKCRHHFLFWLKFCGDCGEPTERGCRSPLKARPASPPPQPHFHQFQRIMARTGSRKACVNCRQRHLRCDGQLRCRRCDLAGIDCDRGLHAFRHVSFDGEQEGPEDFRPQNKSRVSWRRTRWANESYGEGHREGHHFVDETSAVIEAQRDRREGTGQDGIATDLVNRSVLVSVAPLFVHPDAHLYIALFIGRRNARLHSTADFGNSRQSTAIRTISCSHLLLQQSPIHHRTPALREYSPHVRPGPHAGLRLCDIRRGLASSDGPATRPAGSVWPP